MHTAWVIAISQILLVDVNYCDYWASESWSQLCISLVVIIFVIWTAIAFVYDKLSDAA